MNKNTPKISVIVPVYNSEKFLDKCIESILKQTLNDLELILINDGSTDKSGVICEKYKKADERVIYIEKENSGVSDSRNLGIDTSIGKYICFIDSDDYIKYNMMENLYRATEGEFDLVISGMYFERINNDDWNNIIPMYKANNREEIKKGIPELFKSYLLYNPVGKLYKNNIIKKYNLRFDSSMSFGEDPVFNCKYFEKIENYININDSYYIYVKHGEDSLSNCFNRDKIRCNKIMTNSFIKLFEFYGIEEELVFEIMDWRYKKELNDMIFTIARAKKQVKLKDKYNFISQIFKDETYQYLEEYLDGINILLKIIIRTKTPLFLILYFYTTNFLRGNRNVYE